MAVRDDLYRQRVAILAILAIAARHGGSNLRLFGSVVRGEERPDSDVDLLIDLAKTAASTITWPWWRSWRRSLDGMSTSSSSAA